MARARNIIGVLIMIGALTFGFVVLNEVLLTLQLSSGTQVAVMVLVAAVYSAFWFWVLRCPRCGGSIFRKRIGSGPLKGFGVAKSGMQRSCGRCGLDFSRAGFRPPYLRQP